MKIIVLLFTLLTTFCSQAERVIIKGGIQGFEGKELSVNIYEDYISYHQQKLGSQKIKNGSFELSFELKSTRQIILRIEDKETFLYAEPGHIYNISLSYDEEKNQGRAFDRYLDIQFILPQADETNTLIRNFNQQYQAFFSKYYPKFIINAAGKDINNFIEKIEKNQAFKKNTYVSSYVEYALANLKDINKSPRQALFEEYLQDRAILLQHKEYMNFFTQFYKGDFEQITLGKKGQNLLAALVLKKDIKLALEEVKKLKSIKQDDAAELYLLYGLFDVFHKKRIQQDRCIEIFQHIEESSANSDIRLLAGNLKSHLGLYNQDQKTPTFSLNDLTGERKSPEDFEGKLTYLNFWASWSIPSLREMQVIKKLHKDYGTQVNFVSINLDEDISQTKKIAKEYQFNWTILEGGDDFSLREKYGVKTVPSYFLIDEQAKIQQAFAPGPIEMDRKFHELFKN